MATKVKMLKLIHEVSAMAHFAPRRPQQNRSGLHAISPLVVNPLRSPPRRRKVITVTMRDQVDIPTPVKITILSPVAA
jgi:hypothetical protein